MFTSCKTLRRGEKCRYTKILVEKPEGKRPFGRPRRRWENTIRIALREIGWIHLAQYSD